MRREIFLLIGIVSMLISSTALASQTQAFTETFDDGSNEGNWTFGIPPIEVFQEEGGNPGWWLPSTCENLNCLDTFAPQPRTTPIGGESEFTGNYRDRGVTAIGIDLITIHVDFSAEGRPLTLILINDNGNPDDFSDNWGAYYIGSENVPLQGEGWRKFEFDIPAQERSLPDGWQYYPPLSEPPHGQDWNDLMEDVSQVKFFYGDPEMFFIFQQWELGMDNPRITTTCPLGDLNCDGVVDVFDLLILISEWGECDDLDDCPADITGPDGEPDGVVDVFDLLKLISNWG